jgi:hypothetical protein
VRESSKKRTEEEVERKRGQILSLLLPGKERKT